MDDSQLQEEVLDAQGEDEGQTSEVVVTENQQSQQETQDDSNSGDNLDLSAQDVERIVRESMDTLQHSQDVAFDGLTKDVKALGDSIELLSRSTESDDSSEIVTMRVDSSQVETAKAALRVLCTEGLLVVILLALIAGLQGWRIVGDRWRS